MSVNAKGGVEFDRVPSDAKKVVYKAVEQELFSEEHCDSISQRTFGKKLVETQDVGMMFDLSKSHKSHDRIPISDMSEIEVEHNIQLLEKKLKKGRRICPPSSRKRRTSKEVMIASMKQAAGECGWVVSEELCAIISASSASELQPKIGLEDVGDPNWYIEQKKLWLLLVRKKKLEEELDSDSDSSSDSDDSDSDSSSDSDSD